MRSLALLAVALLAGCTQPATQPTPPITIEAGCLLSDAASRDAKLLPAWNASVAEVAARLAGALDDEILGNATGDKQGDRIVWNTTSGSIEALDVGLPPSLTWRTDRDLLSIPDAKAWMRGVVDRFAGADAGKLEITSHDAPQGQAIWYTQSVGGRQVENVGGYVETAYRDMVFGPAYDLPSADKASIREPQAIETAKAYLRCVLDERGQTEAKGYGSASDEGRPPPYVVHNDTLAYRVQLRYHEPGTPSHCGLSLYAYIDAVTGVVLGQETPLCA